MAPAPKVGMPSASAKVLEAVSVWPWVAVPEIVTAPVGASFTLATEEVTLLVTLSACAKLSV